MTMNALTKQGLAEDDKVLIRHMILMLGEFRKLNNEMPIQYAEAFLRICHDEGISIAELTKKVGLSQSATSRNVLALMETQRPGKPGLNLVNTYDDPMDRRRKVVVLKPLGVKTIMDMLKAVRRSVKNICKTQEAL